MARTKAKDAVVNFMQDRRYFFSCPKSTRQFPLGFFCNVKMSLAIMVDKTINLSHKLSAEIKSIFS